MDAKRHEEINDILGKDRLAVLKVMGAVAGSPGMSWMEIAKATGINILEVGRLVSLAETAGLMTASNQR